jgi:hypothetical protein
MLLVDVTTSPWCRLALPCCQAREYAAVHSRSLCNQHMVLGTTRPLQPVLCAKQTCLRTCHSMSCSGCSPCAARYVSSSGLMPSKKSGPLVNRSGSRQPRGACTTSTSRDGSNSICAGHKHKHGLSDWATWYLSVFANMALVVAALGMGALPLTLWAKLA